MEFIGELLVDENDLFLESDLVKFLPSTSGFIIGKHGFEIRDSKYIKDTYLFVVIFDLSVINGTSKERLFYVDVIGCQKFKMNKHEIPNTLACFNVIERAWEKFYKNLDKITPKTFIQQLQRPLPQIEEMKDYIEKNIRTWDNARNNIGLN